MNIKIKAASRLTVFVLAFLVWLLITSYTDRREIVVGLLAALVVAALAGDLIAPRGVKLGPRRIFHFIIYFFLLMWEIFKANLHVAYIVLHPDLPIKPGFVKIKTGLTSEAGLTMLANSITLTPGTLTVDIDREKGFLYVHWITVAGLDLEKNTALIGGRFEKRLREIFQ